VPGRHEFGAPFAHADGLDLLSDTQSLEQGQVGRQQRLADVKTGMPGLLHLHHPVTPLGQHDGGSGARGTPADDENIGL